MTTLPAAKPARSRRQRMGNWFAAPGSLRGLAVAALAANVLIVVTGGAVRLTDSGLGCPTWPSCTSASLVPTRAYSFHGVIEFSNRQLTFVVGLVAALTALAAWLQHRERTLAVVAFLGVPAQAVLGGITVLTDLNPYAVAAHFLLSMAVLFAYALLVWRVTGAQVQMVPGPAVLLARVLVAVTAGVLVIGTVVTGSGPHAGDVRAGVVHRIHVSSSGISQLHADAVMVLVGVTVGMLALCYAVGAGGRAARAVAVLLGVELAQGAIGFTQYFLHVPPLLVAFHMLGACLVWLAAVRVALVLGTLPGRRPDAASAA